MAKIEQKYMTQTVDGKVTRKARDESDAQKGRFNWWRADEEECAQQIASTIKFIQNHQSGRMDQLVASTRLYGNNQAFGLYGMGSANIQNVMTTRVSFNLCSSIVDTIVSKTAKNEVTPSFITTGGTWGMQRKAENLTKFIEGCFYENKVHTKINESVSDAGVWGDGLVYVYRTDDDKAAVERVVPHELLVDPIETLVGNPRQLHRVKPVDRDILYEMFDGDEEAQAKIMSADPIPAKDMGGVGSAADQIMVSESWHLRSSKKAKDGVRAMSIGDLLLLREEYTKDYFPFPKLPYAKNKFGYWAKGACERLQNLQLAINREMILEDKSRHMMGSFKILVENGSKVVSQHLNNEVGAIIHYTGAQPQYVTPPHIQNDSQSRVESFIQKGYQQEGVSQLAAANVKPQGIDSGEALRTYDQISDDRQLSFEKSVEAFGLEIARQMIDVVKDIYKDTKTYNVTWAGSTFMKTVDWKDVRLEEDEYVLKAFPTSSLPEEPAAKLQTVQEYTQAGFITPRAARRLLRMPDVEMADHLADAAEELIMKSIEDILYDGAKDIVPDDEWDLQMAKMYSIQYLNYAKLNNCPENRLELLRTFMSQVDNALGLTDQPQAGVDATGTPQAQAMPAPQSDLIPNVPQTGAA